MKRIPTETNPLDILKALDDWAFRAPNSSVRAMWAILTALRGPDDENYEVKEATTAVIRSLTLPIMASRAGALVSGPQTTINDIKNSSPSVHFDLHIKWAKKSLIDLDHERC